MESFKTDNLILSPRQVAQKISRMAHEVYEHNIEEPEVVFAGIRDTGYALAQALREAFDQIAPIPSRLVELTLDKQAPTQAEVNLDCSIEEVEGRTVILVDDVLNTGRTLAYALRPFLKVSVRKIQVAVLVDRSYHSFPILAQYVGYQLSTTVNDHVHVVSAKEAGSFAVYLD